MISEKVNESSRRWRHGVATASVLVLLAGVAPVQLRAEDSKPAGAQALIERAAPDNPDLGLPALPDVVVEVDAGPAEPKSAEASPPAEAKPAETASTLPDKAPEPALRDVVVPPAPEIEIAEDLKAPLPVQKADVLPEPKLDLPAPPAVVVSVEVPAAPVLRLAIDEAGIRALLEPARQRYRFKASEMDALAAAYAERDFRPVWLAAQPDGSVGLQPRVAALSKFFSEAEQDGLDAVRLLSSLPGRLNGPVAAEKQVETDLAVSIAAFLYARDARGGRIEPTRLSSLLTPELELPQAGALIEAIADLPADRLVAMLAGFNPQHAGYRALRAELTRLRRELSEPVLTGSVAGLAGAPQPAASLPARWLEGPPLAFNKADPRVALLRSRLGLPADGGEIYDSELRKAVQTFQRANGLTPNGQITPKTRAALENAQSPLNEAERKTDRRQLMNNIIANMERWRWLPADLGEFHVFVNVPDYRLQLMQDGQSVHETRVIVGKPQTQTPIFSDRMDHLIVNPSWGVPPSILKKEFLPKMATDPDYAARRGFQVIRRGNSISIRQPPGERNALGFVKFMFPNSHSVYLHDTPNRSLFANETRAFSHGCVRVDKPFAFAEKLLSTSLGYSEGFMRGMIGRGERMIRLPRKIPVHLSYFTVFVDEDGKLQERRDIYGHDARVRGALQL